MKRASSVTSLLLTALILSSCASSSLQSSTSGPSSTAETPVPSAVITPVTPPVVMTSSPAQGATDVAVDTIATVSAVHGTLTDVALNGRGKDAKGAAFTDAVDGELGADGISWTAASRLEPNATYTAVMTGNDVDGEQVVSSSTFSTQELTLKQQSFPILYPAGGGSYGVAMPIIVRFDLPVKNRASFQRHMKVSATPAQNGSWSWLTTTEAHYRPKNFWRPGTKVAVNIDVNSLPAGDGIYGQLSRQLNFTIGNSLITRVNLASHYATVTINGKTVRNIPVSGGKSGFTTRSGTKVITEKLATTTMRSETVGIAATGPEGYDLKVKYAMRITNSGEFLHAAPWNGGNFGRRNASHGCVGMSTSDAGWLFNRAQVGDPVVVRGTGRSLESGNGITDGNISWDQFAKGSALK